MAHMAVRSRLLTSLALRRTLSHFTTLSQAMPRGAPVPREVAHLMAEVNSLGGNCDAQLASTAVLACVPHGNAFTCSDDGTQLCACAGGDCAVRRASTCAFSSVDTVIINADVHDGDTPSFTRRRCYAVADVVDADALSQTPDCLTSSGVAAEARAWLQQGFNATVLTVSPVRTRLLRAMPCCRSSGLHFMALTRHAKHRRE